MTRLVIYPDNTFELLPDRPPARRPRPLELAGYFLGAVVISGAGLLALPLVITVLGAIAPLAAVGWFVAWAIKRTRR